MHEADVQRGIDVHKLKVTKSIPALLSRDVARVASDLRSALDQTGYATARANGNTRLKYTYFPFAASAPQIDSVIRGRCKDLPKDIVALFRSFKAYRGGDDLLWSVNEIANGVKHRFIVPVGHGIGPTIIDHFKAEQLVEMKMPPQWDSVHDEIVFCTVKHGSYVNYDINLGFYVAFGDVEGVRGMHVIPILKTMSDKVAGIIDATEAEARRIGLIT
jgi:hypothetical protein